MSLSTITQGLFQRQRDRLRSERVAADADDDNSLDEEEGSFLNGEQREESNTNEHEPAAEEEETTETTNEDDGVNSFVARPTMTLAELEEEVRNRLMESCRTLLNDFSIARSGPSSIVCLLFICRFYFVSLVDFGLGQFRYVTLDSLIDCLFVQLSYNFM